MSQGRIGLIVVLVMQGILGALLTVGVFTGPDATSYMTFVFDGQDPNYWLDPKAYEGNFFPMGYPAFLTATVALMDGSTLLYEALSVLMGLAVTTLIFAMMREHSVHVRVSTAAAVALCPSVLWMMQNNGYEMLLSVLIVASFFLILRIRSGTVKYWRTLTVFAGVMLGGAALVQSKVLVLLPIFLLLLRHSRVRVVLAVSGALALPGIWGLRNLFVTGNPYPFSSNAGMGLWLGNNPVTIDGGVVASAPATPPGTNSLADAALQFVVSQPEAAFTLLGRRIARLLSPTYLYRDSLLPELNVALHWYAIGFVSLGVFLFAAFSFGRLWIRYPVFPDVTVLAIPVLAFFAVHFPFQSEPRYMTPIVPLAVAVAVPTTFALVRKMRGLAPID